MAVSYDVLMAIRVPERHYGYTRRDTMLYALGVGLGADPVDRRQLDFVYEKRLKALPSMATVIAWDDAWLRSCGIDFAKVVHGEQRLRLHRPIPVEGRIVSEVHLRAAWDKGPGRGAVLLIGTEILEATSRTPLCSLESVVFARGDGGFGGPAGGPEPLPKPPERDPDAVSRFATSPQAALIYRLSGDDNPLHCDPDAAEAGGFPRPILHGLATWGNACHAVLKDHCDYDPARIAGFAARFTAPVYPGETLATESWREGDRVHFRTRVVERDVVALDLGIADLAGASP